MIKCKVDLQKFGLILVSIFAVVFFAFSYDKYYFPKEEHHHYIYINVTKAIFTTDKEFLSVGDWELLAKFAKSLSPAYLRLGGTAADEVLFNLNDIHQGNERNEHQFNPNGDNFIAGDYLKISGRDWLEFNDFVEKSGLRLLFDLNVLLRNGSHWDSHNAEALLSFSNAHDIQMDFQLGNEPNAFQHVFNISISGAQLGEDFQTLRNILSGTHKFNSSKLIGPDVTRPKHLEESSVNYLKDFLANVNNLSAVSWHQYYLNGRTATLKEFMDPEIFDLLPKQINAIKEVVKGFSNFLDVPIWLSETSSAYGGGAPGLSDRYVASFLWVDKLGLAARMGIKVVIRQSLYQGHYSLIDDNLSPLPDFWVSLIYKVLVGRKVLHIKYPRQPESNLRLYSHCLKKNKNVKDVFILFKTDMISGNVVLFGMNLENRTEFVIPGGLNTHHPITSLVLTPENLNLTSRSVLLNGRRLEFNGTEIDIVHYFPSPSEKIPLKMPPYSLVFWIFHGEREGNPLSWEETQALADHVREHGIIQFINLYEKLKNRQGDYLKWGDEVEYMIVKFDHEKKTAKLSLRAQEILPVLQKAEKENPEMVKSLWRPEYASYMIEGTPGKPYGGLLSFFNTVEANMRLRREEATALLHPDEYLMSITSYPRLGCPNFTDPPARPTPKDGASKSLFFPDEAINGGHPRFKTLTRNIRMRRQEKVSINMPIFKDENTPWPFVENFEELGDDGESARAARPNHVYMDAVGFGMGCCCLQLTFQACNINEARTLYDQLTPLCPIMLALTAASPFYRGRITDVDCRWNVISESVDCRTREERGLEPLKKNRFVIPKSRYDSIDSYISECGKEYNDVPLIYDEAIYKRLRDSNIDHLLSQHIAHLFIRDTVSLFSEKVDQDDTQDSDHFENIQSTNWQTMRFKPPPLNSSIGWRVEFRPCEVQITDIENAAIVCFVVLLTRVILSYQLNFIIPISKVDENMQKAHRRNSLLEEFFWFRKDILTCVSPPEAASCCKQKAGQIYVPMSINHIINGKEGEFPGLIPLINSYLSGMDVDADTHCTIQQYLKLIQRRASGELKTPASYLRDFVSKHPEYKKDSYISEKINYDLLKHIMNIQLGKEPCPEILGLSIKSKTQEFIPAAVSKAYESKYSSFKRENRFNDKEEDREKEIGQMYRNVMEANCTMSYVLN